jgi:hypothetical protein
VFQTTVFEMSNTVRGIASSTVSRKATAVNTVR